MPPFGHSSNSKLRLPSFGRVGAEIRTNRNLNATFLVDFEAHNSHCGGHNSHILLTNRHTLLIAICNTLDCPQPNTQKENTNWLEEIRHSNRTDDGLEKVFGIRLTANSRSGIQILLKLQEKLWLKKMHSKNKQKKLIISPQPNGLRWA